MPPAFPPTWLPDRMRLAVPADGLHDSWLDVDDAVHVERDDMRGNWIVQAVLHLVDYEAGGPFHAALSVRFGPHDLLFWGPYRGTSLQLDRSGASGLIRYVYSYDATVHLQIQKTGNNYTFLHRARSSDRWIVDGYYRTTDPVVAVGFTVKTWEQPTALTAEVDLATLISSVSDEGADILYTATSTSAFVDAGDGPYWDPFQHQYTFGSVFWRHVPVPGPILSLTANPGYHRIYLPHDRAYDHTAAVDDAPQLWRDDLGCGDWTIETGIDLLLEPGAGAHAGLMVRFGPHDVILWGFHDGTALRGERTGSGPLASAAYGHGRVVLRIQRMGDAYTFWFAPSPEGPWIAAGSHATTDPVHSIGIMARTRSAVALIVDFDHVALTRVPLSPGDTGYSLGHTSDFSGAIDAAWTPEIPVRGPTIEAAPDSGCARLIIPAEGPAYDDWASVDAAPKLLRGDMGAADWLVETKLIVRGGAAGAASAAGAAFQTGLAVIFDQHDHYLWGTRSGAALALDHSAGHAGLLRLPYDQPVVYLRVEKKGARYAFSYKTPGSLIWTAAGVRSHEGGVAKIGVFARTWKPGVGLAVDVDYVHLTRVDAFTSATLDAAWTPSVTLPGPTWSATGAGAVRLTIPRDRSYDAAAPVPAAPRLERGDMGGADWDLRAAVCLVSHPTESFQAGLMARFAGGGILSWGFGDGADLHLIGRGPNPESTPTMCVSWQSHSVWLRILRIGAYYLLYHASASTEPWIYDGSLGPIQESVVAVGLMGATRHPAELVVDVGPVELAPISGGEEGQ